MPVNLNLADGIAIDGISLSSLSAGIKADGSNDLLLVQLPEGSTCAGVFTKNLFCAAPVTVAKNHLAQCKGSVRAMLINSGNANAGTGQPGIALALEHCEAVANAVGISQSQVLPFSTGVIGQMLPNANMLKGIQAAAQKPGADWPAAAQCIMTTDTVPKLTSKQVNIGNDTVTITGMAKGAGMIQPNMATMLAYLFTDANINSADLHAALTQSVAASFNSITVDSDTSTNDACMVVATGEKSTLNASHPDWNAFVQSLSDVALLLAQAIVRDAEGATKFITVMVTGGDSTEQCKTVGMAIANSPLVKTAMFASDANVGRLLMAIGKTELEALDPNLIRVSIGDVLAFEKSGIADGYTEELGAAVMAEEEITIKVDLGKGEAGSTVYTSDLSHEYVSVNADYRS